MDKPEDKPLHLVEFETMLLGRHAHLYAPAPGPPAVTSTAARTSC